MAGKLTHKQQATIRALLECKTITQAATQAGVSERSIYRWLRAPVFRAALLEAEGEAIDGATRRLVALQGRALDTYERLLGLFNLDPGLQRLTARDVLDLLVKLRELRNLEKRLSDLERAVYGEGDGNEN